MSEPNNKVTWSRLVPVPEHRSALLALEGVAECVCSRRQRRRTNPLSIYGPSGCGKSHLVKGLAEDVIRRSPDRVITLLNSREFAEDAREHTDPATNRLTQAAADADLLIIEDVQNLPVRSAGSLVQLMDELVARQQQIVFTGSGGPQQLVHLPARLTNRMAGSLVVGVQALAAPSRLAVLEAKAQRRQLAVPRIVLAWLAENLTGGGRQLEGALSRLEMLARCHNQPLDLATVVRHFQEQAEAGRPTIDRIVQRVGGYFQVEPRHLQSARRSHKVLLPRQISMYLARQLTELSLNEIGASFGGRDHSTVLHACRKVKRALKTNALVAGAVRQLHADLA
jgi:chromosomal replication initiator protein